MERPKPVIEKLSPIGSHKAPAFVNRGLSVSGETLGGLEVIEVSDYPPPEFDFRKWRLDRRMTLGEIAKKLEVSPADVSGLEYGRNRPVDSAWAELLSFLEDRCVCLCNDVERNCGHKWDGWITFLDENGDECGGSSVCAYCEADAMSHDLLVMP